MINVLTPENIAYALVELQEKKRTLNSIAVEFGIQRGTLRKAIHESKIYGYKAFSFKMLKSKIQPLCVGRSLKEAYQAVVAAGYYDGSQEAFRHAAYYANIDYQKTGSY